MRRQTVHHLRSSPACPFLISLRTVRRCAFVRKSDVSLSTSTSLISIRAHRRPPVGRLSDARITALAPGGSPSPPKRNRTDPPPPFGRDAGRGPRFPLPPAPSAT